MTQQTPTKYPSVAVIIPTHNRWPMLAEAIESVLNQNYNNVICVVVDDASTDRSVVELESRYGNRITLLKNETNREKSSSRNRGVQEVEADFVCFLDSDDLLTENSLSLRMHVFLDDPEFSGVAYGATIREKAVMLKGDSLGKQKNDQKSQALNLQIYLENKDAVHTSGFLIRRSTLLAEGIFCEDLTNREDIELFIRLLLKYEFRHCGESVSVLRTHGDDRARSNWDKIIRQGQGMSLSLEKALADNTSDSIKNILQKIKKEECEELLRALYRKKYYADFLVLYKQAKGDDFAPNNFQWLKRKYLALLKSAFTSNTAPVKKIPR